MAIRTAATASAVVRPAISIIRRTRANSAACSGVGSGSTGLGHARLCFKRLIVQIAVKGLRSLSRATRDRRGLTACSRLTVPSCRDRG